MPPSIPLESSAWPSRPRRGSTATCPGVHLAKLSSASPASATRRADGGAADAVRRCAGRRSTWRAWRPILGELAEGALGAARPPVCPCAYVGCDSAGSLWMGMYLPSPGRPSPEPLIWMSLPGAGPHPLGRAECRTIILSFCYRRLVSDSWLSGATLTHTAWKIRPHASRWAPAGICGFVSGLSPL